MEEKWSDKSWSGYLRQDGRKGIRNKVLLVYTVECSAHVTKEIARTLNHPDVDLIGFSGCTDNAYAVRMILSLVRHPNVGAVLAVGLGCEYVQPQKIAAIAAEAGRLSDWFFIQENGGTGSSIEKGAGIVNQMLRELEKTPRIKMGFADLVVGAECGGSDYTSGLAGNVMVGRFYDFLTSQGGAAMFEEIVEAVGLKQQLVKRGRDETVRAQLAATYDKAMDYCRAVRQYSVSPGNFAGGLSTIEEKSMGAIIKSGTAPIEGVIQVAKQPPGPGLWLLDSTPDPHWMEFGYTNPNDNEGLMDLISCGCHLTFLVTGRGNVVGSAVAPVYKITGNSKTYHNMIEDMDFDAGRALDNSKTLPELDAELCEAVFEICCGRQTKAEHWNHKEYFIPYKYQDEAVLKAAVCKQKQ